MPQTQRELWNRLTVILETAVTTVSGCGYPVDSSAVEYGEISWDDCCDEGHAFIRVVRMNVTNPFPQATLAPVNCHMEVGALVELGILRCVANLDAEARAPSASEREADSLQITRDASILFNVIHGLGDDVGNFPPVIDHWEPLGPEGACAGGAWQFWIDVALCECGFEDEG